MNHPKPEEWVPYLYGEAPAIARQALKAHLKECPQCRDEVETWKRSLHRLDAWKVPRGRRSWSLRWAPSFRWAAAASLVLLAGACLGRVTAPKVDANQLRTALLPQIRKELQQETLELVRQESARSAALSLASSQRYADQVGQQVYLAVKKQLDTLAVNTDAGLRNTAEQLVQLADYNVPQTTNQP